MAANSGGAGPRAVGGGGADVAACGWPGAAAGIRPARGGTDLGFFWTAGFRGGSPIYR